ncbi:MAG: hypothetical protein AB8F95_06415 [Bacteroidia bacterium]
MKKLLQTSASTALLDQGMVSGINLLVTVLLGRTLGLEGFGEYAFGWMIVLLASSLHQAILLTPMKSLAPQQKSLARYFAGTVQLQAVCMLIAFPAMWLAASLLDLSIAFPLAAVAFLSQEYMRRRAYVANKANRAFILDIIAYGSWLTGLVALAWAGQLTVETAYYSLAVSFGLSALLGMVQSDFSAAKLFAPAFGNVWKLHWNFGAWLTGTAILQYFAGNAFLLAAGLLLGNAALGLIRAIQTLMGVLHVFLLAAEHIVPVKAAAQYALHGSNGLEQYLKALASKVAIPTVLLLAIVAAFGEQMLTGIFNITQPINAGLIPLFVISYLGTVASFPLRIALRSVAHTRPFFIAYILSAGLGLLLAKPLIATIGITGVPAGFILSQAITFGCLYFSWKHFTYNQSSPQLFNN